MKIRQIPFSIPQQVEVINPNAPSAEFDAARVANQYGEHSFADERHTLVLEGDPVNNPEPSNP